jgi:hypothetical protein
VKSRTTKRLLALAVLASVSALLTTMAGAQPKPAGRKPAPSQAAPKPATPGGGKKKPQKEGGAPEPDAVDTSAPITTRAESTAAAQVGAPKDAGILEQKTLDGGAKVFRFGEVEIEGRLRSPQLVYFLRRVRAEFAAGDLGHRSFMRELSETRRDPNF